MPAPPSETRTPRLRGALGGAGALRAQLRSPDTLRAGGLAAATLISNAVQLAVVMLFTRLLGVGDYGSLAALVSAFLVLLVGGQALQVAAARETALGRLGAPAELAGTVRAWARRMLAAAALAGVAGYLLRDPIGHVVGVPEHSFAAAAILPTGVLWGLLSLQRGVLQGLRQYVAVGGSLIAESVGRLVFGGALVVAGAGVTGAFLGMPLAMALTAGWMAFELHRAVGPAAPVKEPRSLGSLTAGAWAPIGGLALLALLQNVDVIIVKHRLDDDAAGAYAAAAVAAKAVVWIAIGLALQVLPEATARTAAGLDPRPVLQRALAVGAAVALPGVAVLALAPTQVLRLAFSEETVPGAEALPPLAIAMTLLAVSYLMVQYMIALGNRRYLPVLAVVALAEPFVLTAGDYSLRGYGVALLGIQLVACAGLLLTGLRARAPVPAAPAAAESYG